MKKKKPETVTFRVGDLNMQELREEGKRYGYELLSGYLRHLIKVGRVVHVRRATKQEGV